MMNIDKVIRNFDFDKFKSDCFIHAALKTYIDKKSKLSLCSENEAGMLSAELKDYSDILLRCLKNALCFPSGCKDCTGMQKCADCFKQKDLGEEFIRLRNFL